MYQNLNSNAVTWSLAGRVYGIHSIYRWIPLGLILGPLPVIFQWLISRRWKKIGPLSVDKIILPYTMGYIALLSVGINSIVWSCKCFPFFFGRRRRELTCLFE